MSEIGFIFLINNQIPLRSNRNYEDKILLHNLVIMETYNPINKKRGIFMKNTNLSKKFIFKDVTNCINDLWGIESKYIENLNPIPKRFPNKKTIYCVVLKPSFTKRFSKLKETIEYVSGLTIFNESILLPYDFYNLDKEEFDLFLSIKNYNKSKFIGLRETRIFDTKLNEYKHIVTLSDIIDALVGLIPLRDEIKLYLKIT